MNLLNKLVKKENISSIFLIFLIFVLDRFSKIKILKDFGENSILAYNQLPAGFNFTGTNGGQAILKLLQVIGVISFVRGWVLLARSQGQGSQPGSMGKGVIHIFGGVMLMNIVATVNIVYNTLGVNF